MSNTTVIGKGIRIQGEITGSAPIEVWGDLDGTAGTEGILHVREGGKIHGEMAAREIVVEGEVDGRVIAETRADLRPSCKMKGELTAATVTMAEGAFFEGRIHMTKDGGKGVGKS